MSGLSPDERDAIQTAIESVEKRTSAEFVTVIAKSVESYLYIPTLVAALVTLIISGVLLLFREILAFSVTELYGGQVVVFAVLALSFRIPKIPFALVPKLVRLARASNHARKMFLALGMTETEDRNAVLLFIALGALCGNHRGCGPAAKIRKLAGLGCGRGEIYRRHTGR